MCAPAPVVSVCKTSISPYFQCKEDNNRKKKEKTAEEDLIDTKDLRKSRPLKQCSHQKCERLRKS